jgi:hypothetical protein
MEGDGEKDAFSSKEYDSQWGNLVSGPGVAYALETFTLTCLLRHWKNLNPESLRKKILIFYCTQVGLNIFWEIRSAG